MTINIIDTDIEGPKIIEPTVFKDNRGYFKEVYQEKDFIKFGIKDKFVQDNLSFSKKNILRGLHFQQKKAQAKLIQVIYGEIFDVAVDVRKDSKNFGKWVGAYLNDKNHRQFFIPEGFAHGYCVTSDAAYVYYKCSDFYCPDDEKGLMFNDKSINIKWPVLSPILSDKDKKNLLLIDL